MFSKSQLGLGISLALSSSCVFSQDSIETITVTANKIEQSIENVLATVHVIDRDAIEKSNVRDLPALLQSVAGIEVVRKGGQGQTSTLIVRGASSSHSLIIIDGVKVGSASLGYKSISTVPLNSIERVEIVKGSRAAWYGSDALGGVINIFTRNGDSSSVTLSSGSNNYKNAQFAYGVSTEHYQVSLNAGYEKTDGYDVTTALALDNDGYENKNIGINAQYDAKQFGELSFIAQYSEGEVEYDSAFAGNDLQQFEDYHGAITWQKSTDKVTNKLQYSFSQDKSVDTMSMPSEWHKASQFQTDRNEVNYLLVHHFDHDADFSFGADWQQDNLEDSINAWAGPNDPVSGFSDDSRENFGAYLGGYFNGEQFKLNAVARVDDNSDFGNNTTYNLAIGLPVADNIQLRASHGTGFKAPSFNDASSIWGTNPDLAPEESTSTELGLAVDFDSAQVDLALFKNDIDNLISWANGIPENIKQAEIEGIEISSQFSIFGLDNQLNLAYIDTLDTDSGEALPLRAKQTASWILAKQFDAWYLALEMHARSSSKSYYGKNLAGYTLWHVSAKYNMLDNLYFNLRIDNLSDKAYTTDVFASDWQTQEPLSYYQGAGRQAFAGFSYHF